MDETLFDDTPETAPPMPRTTANIVSGQVKKLRQSHEYRVLHDEFRTSEANRWIGKTRGAPCWLCGGDIDYRLQYPHPLSWSLDHALAVSKHPELLFETNNFRSSHLDCNQQRSNDEPKLDIGVPSEIW